MARLTDDERARLVGTLLETGFGTAERQRLLWTDDLGPWHAHTPSTGNPRDALFSALATLDGAPPARDADPLADFLWRAWHLSPRSDPRAGLFADVAARIDRRRRPALGLVRRVHGQRTTSPELTVRLERRGDGARVSWYSGGLRLPFAARDADGGRLEASTPQDLFATLFPGLGGADPDPAGVLRALFGDASPFASALRLRVCTDEPRWAALHWATVTWNDRRLTATALPWTIEVTHTAAPELHVELPRLPEVVVLQGARLDTESVRGALRNASRQYATTSHITAVDRLDALPAHLAGRGRAILITHDLDRDALAVLGGLLAERVYPRERPSALCLIAPPAALDPTPLLRHVPVIVQVPDIDAARRWLVRVTVDECDPVIAAHGGDAREDDVAHAIASAYARWTPGRVRRSQGVAPALVLDRYAQRDRALDRLDALLDPDAHHRVEVFIASGPPQNQIELLAEQIEEHIATRKPSLDLHICRLDLPREGTYPIAGAARWLSAALALHLGLHGEHTPASLAHHLARDHEPGIRRVVWLDWGTFGHRADRPALRKRELRRWLDWHATLAEAAHRENLRVAGFIACETDNGESIDAIVDEAIGATNNTCIEFTRLAPLKAVEMGDLRRYLNDKRNSQVLKSQVGPLTRAIWSHVPDGDFGRLVELLEEGLRDGWDVLLARLGGERAPKDDDDDLL